MELLFGFLWFHHKTIVAIILLTALGVWGYGMATRPKPVIQPSAAPVTKRTIENDAPKANIDFVLSSKLATEKTDLTQPKNEESNGSDEAADNSPKNIPNKLLESGTVAELIEASLKIHETWGYETPSVGLIMCVEQARISRRLLELELSDSQRIFALASYIDSISTVDSLNVASKMKIVGTRKALLEIDEKYSNHPDPTICAKANLAMTMAPLYDVIADGEVESLHEFQKQFNQRIEKIALDQAALARLADVSIAMFNKHTTPETSEPVILDLMEQLYRLKTPSSRPIAERFCQRYLFDRFELETLAKMVRLEEEEARERVRAFFKTLAAYPDSGFVVYDAAIKIVKSYRQIGNISDAEALLIWLDDISNEIPAEQNRQAVKDAILKMRSE